MSNYFPQEMHLIFDPSIPLDIFGDEDMVKERTKQVLEMFQPNKMIDELIVMFKTFNWTEVGSEDYKNFEKHAHSLKGQCKWTGIERLAHYFERLQFKIRDCCEIQVAVCLDEILQWCVPTQIELIKYSGADIPVRHFDSLQMYLDEFEGIQIRQKIDYHPYFKTVELNKNAYQPQSSELENNHFACNIF